MTIHYEVSSAHAGYGARIWVDKLEICKNPTLMGVMNGLSMWGGHDKSDGHLISWEFADEDFLLAEAALIGADCVRVECL